MSFLTIIVATDKQGGIGINNALPWHLPEDLAHFKRTTSGHAIIMGRKTFDSIGRALPNRRNIVVTRNNNWEHDGVESVTSLQAAQEVLNEDHAFIIGGAQIYQQALSVANQLIVTEIQEDLPAIHFFLKSTRPNGKKLVEKIITQKKVISITQLSHTRKGRK